MKINQSKIPQFEKSFLLPKYWLIWLGYFTMIILSWLPYSWLEKVGYLIGEFFAKSDLQIFKRRRFIIKRNLELAFPEMSTGERQKILEKNIRNSGKGIIYQVMSWYYSDKKFASVVKLPKLDLDQYKDKHFIVLSPHFLEMELSARAVLTVMPNTYGVYRPHTNPLWEYFQFHGRMKAVPSKDQLIDRKNLRSMLRVIGENSALWYAPDHDYGWTSTTFVKFFAVNNASTTIGSHMLYRKYPDLKIVPIVTQPVKGGFEFRVLDLVDIPEGFNDQQLARYINEIIENLVLENLENYMLMHRRYKTNDGEDRYKGIDDL